MCVCTYIDIDIEIEVNIYTHIYIDVPRQTWTYELPGKADPPTLAFTR